MYQHSQQKALSSNFTVCCNFQNQGKWFHSCKSNQGSHELLKPKGHFGYIQINVSHNRLPKIHIIILIKNDLKLKTSRSKQWFLQMLRVKTHFQGSNGIHSDSTIVLSYTDCFFQIGTSELLTQMNESDDESKLFLLSTIPPCEHSLSRKQQLYKSTPQELSHMESG